MYSHIEEKMKMRVKPDFGADTHVYFTQLINKEKQQLELLINCKYSTEITNNE